MASGGYREPKGGPRAKGVGKNSQRTDAAQPIDVPNVGDSSDLSQGDRQKLEAGMRVQPIGRAATPSIPSAPPSGGSPSPAGGGGALPEHLFSMPTNRPGEPITEGLPFGPGGGPEVLQSYQAPDDRELILRFLARGGNEDAHRMLSGMVDSKRPPEMQAEPALMPMVDEQEEAFTEEVELPDEDLGAGEEVAGEEVDQTSVETPAASSEEEPV